MHGEWIGGGTVTLPTAAPANPTSGTSQAEGVAGLGYTGGMHSHLGSTARGTIERAATGLGETANRAETVGERSSRLDALTSTAPRDWRREAEALADLVREHPLAAVGLGAAAGMVLALGGDERTWARLRRRLRHGLRLGTAMAATTGAAMALDRLLASRPRVQVRTEPDPRLEGEPDEGDSRLEALYDAGAAQEEAAWLISAEEARAFPDLPVNLAEERVGALWDRLARESLSPRELCLAGDRVARLAHSHPLVLAPDVLRLFDAWPVLASADATVGAQVAWTAGCAGAQRVVSALDAVLQAPGIARTVAEAFVAAALGYAAGGDPPLSHGAHTPPSTVYPHPWRRDGRRGGGGPPPGGAGRPGRREAPNAVYLGAAAPHSVRPRNQFLASFAAYTAAYATWVQERLIQEVLPEELRLGKKQVSWKEGTNIVVVPASDALEFDPPQAEFTWNGRFEIQEFACAVRDDAPLGTTVLEFQVGARVPDGGLLQFEKVRVSLGIVEDAPVRTRRLVSRLMGMTAFASYATEDHELVSYKLSPLGALDIRVYDWRLNAKEGERIEEAIEPEIRGCDLFYLFWSRNAQKSEWVEWELGVALDAEQSGRPRIIPQLLENLDPERDGPPALHGRQFLNPFFLLSRPEHVRELVARIGESNLAPAAVEAAYSAVPGSTPGGPDAPGGAPRVPAKSSGDD